MTPDPPAAHFPTDDPAHVAILNRIESSEERFTVALESVASDMKARGEADDRVHRFLFGGPEGPGIAEMVRRHERWIGMQLKLFAVLVPAVLLGAAATVWQAVVTVLANHG